MWIPGLGKRKKKDKSEIEENQTSDRVTMPYTKGLSERITGKMRKHNIDVVHKPTTTIKTTLCSKAKDLLDPMDKPGAVYKWRNITLIRRNWDTEKRADLQSPCHFA